MVPATLLFGRFFGAGFLTARPFLTLGVRFFAGRFFAAGAFFFFFFIRPSTPLAPIMGTTPRGRKQFGEGTFSFHSRLNDGADATRAGPPL